MAILRAMAFGYLGAVLAGVAAAIFGVAVGLSEQSVVAVATPAGVVFGTIGLCLPWRHAIAARVKVGRPRRPRG